MPLCSTMQSMAWPETIHHFVLGPKHTWLQQLCIPDCVKDLCFEPTTCNMKRARDITMHGSSDCGQRDVKYLPIISIMHDTNVLYSKIGLDNS